VTSTYLKPTNAPLTSDKTTTPERPINVTKAIGAVR